MSETSLGRVQADLVEAEAEVRKIDVQMSELHECKRAAAAKVDVLARQRETLMRSDPARKRMVIGTGR